MAGAIGAVREVHINQNKLFWDPPTALPTENPPIPEGLDWNLWLGPAPARPYHPVYHPWRWRDWLDFGTGPLGDMGCHILSTPFKALNLTHPETIVAEAAEPFGPEIYCRRFRVRFEFPARGEMPPVAVTWHDQDFEPPQFPEAGTGQRLRWDGPNLRFTNSKEANQFLSRSSMFCFSL